MSIPMIHAWRYTLLVILSALSLSAAGVSDKDRDWTEQLADRIEALDQESKGELGVVVRRLNDDTTLDYQGQRYWYLASAVKLPIAIVLLQQVENGELTLDDELTLSSEQRIDGAGDLLWQTPGRRYDIRDLLKRMLIDSDNVATDMLIEAIGKETLNDRVQNMTQQGFFAGKGFKPITTLAEVRYGIYEEIHPAARDLDREQLVKIAAADIGPERIDALVRTLEVSRDALDTEDMDTAYARYYQRGLNSATLESYAGLLTALVRGELLNDEHQALLFQNLKIDSYDDYRLEAGLPHEVTFIQKTGTQHQRACHMGVIYPDQPDNALVVTACIENMDEGESSERLLEKVGAAVSEVLLAEENNT